MYLKNILFLGTAYTGKSSAAATFVANVERDFVIIVHDRRDPSYFAYIEPHEVRFLGLNSDGYIITPQLLNTTRSTYRYLWLTVYDLTKKELQSMLSSLIYSVKKSGNLSLLIDEARLFASRFIVPPDVVGFMRGARRYGVDLLLVSHRLVDIDPDIRCIMSYLFLFRTTEYRDLLNFEFGIEQVPIAVEDLPDHEFLFIDKRMGSVEGPFTLSYPD